MKTKIFILAAMSFTMVGFAQKTEIKAAEKALKAGDAMTAKTALEGASGTIDAADAKLQAQYYSLKGKALTEIAKGGDNTAFSEAVDSFKKVVAIEEKSGKVKYTADSNQRLASITADLVNSAVEDNGNKNFKEAGEKLYLSYKISPQDTTYLYYAASSAINGAHYEQALSYYNELQEIGYDGSGIEYKATNNETGEVETMDRVQRDLMVKSGTYKDPVDEKTPSKRAEIVKNTALIYGQLGQDDKALEAYAKARASNPEDVNLILQEANLHYKLGDKDKFKTLMAEAATMEPDNADLHYNIGVINMEQGNLADARASYLKALEVDPGYINAQLNLSTTYVNEGNGLIDEMNTLGNSRKDIARYDELKQQKDNLFNEGAKVLEDALKQNPDNQGILSQLKNIYGAMGDNDNFMRIKKLLGE
ncbi:tetratricopeptide repeat protein [Maribacter sp. 2308TA10-17]|uniref:tetratricopeptide repeat protein n=1 Tax=Maribacter sp. 2308TA10-17 TaxID=3386276 RepID=UPI0039BCB7CD